MIKFSKLFPWKRRPKIIKTKIVEALQLSEDEMEDREQKWREIFNWS